MSKSRLWIIVAIVAAVILAVGGSAYAATMAGQDGVGNGQANQNRNAPADSGQDCTDCDQTQAQDRDMLQDGPGDNCDGTCDGECDGTCDGDGDGVQTQNQAGPTATDRGSNGNGPETSPGNQATVRTAQQDSTSTTGTLEQFRERAQDCTGECEEPGYGPSDNGQAGPQAGPQADGNGNSADAPGDQDRSRDQLQDPEDCDGAGPVGTGSGPQGPQGSGGPSNGGNGYDGECPNN